MNKKITEKHEKRKNIKKTITHLSLAIFCLSISLYILFPTLDELFIHPSLGLFLAELLGLSFIAGAFISSIAYRGIGLMFFTTALVFGGRAIYKKIKINKQ